MSGFNWTPSELQEIVDGNDLVIFMKGTPEQPQCGFSSRGAQIVSAFAREVGLEQFACVNVLSDSRARTALKECPFVLSSYRGKTLLNLFFFPPEFVVLFFPNRMGIFAIPVCNLFSCSPFMK